MGRIVVHAFATLDGVIEASPAEAYQPYRPGRQARDHRMDRVMAANPKPTSPRPNPLPSSPPPGFAIPETRSGTVGSQ